MAADKDSHKGSSTGAGKSGSAGNAGSQSAKGAGGFESRSGQGTPSRSSGSQSSRSGSTPSGARGSGQPGSSSRSSGGLAGAAGLSSRTTSSRSITGAGGRTASTGGIPSGRDALGSNASYGSTTRGLAGRTASTGGVAAKAPARGSEQRATTMAGKTAGTGGLAKAAGLGNYESTVPNVSGDTRFNLRDNDDRRQVRATQAAPQVSFRQTEEAAMARENAMQDLLGLIRPAEAGKIDPYNRIVAGGALSYAPLTSMTIREVRELQRRIAAAPGYGSDALGAYQFVGGTLGEALRRTGISEEVRFTPAIQDTLARDLVRERARQATRKADGTVSPKAFGDRLANEWAALKNSSGAGAYDGDGVNRATVPNASLRAVSDRVVSTGGVGLTQVAIRDEGRKVADIGRRTVAGVDQNPTRVSADVPIPTARPKQSAQERMKIYLSREGLADAEAARKVLASGPIDWDTARAMIATDRARKGVPWKEVPVPAEFVREQVPMQAPVQDSQRVVPAGSEPVAPQREIAPAAPVAPVDDGAVAPTTPIAPVRRATSPALAPTQDQSIAPVAPNEAVAPIDDTRPAKKAPSLGKQIAAAGIDVGLGMVPGVGIAASIFNGVSTLAGGPTLGTMAVDLFGGKMGDNQYRPGDRDYSSRSSSRTVLEEPQAARDEGQKETVRERVRRRYLLPPEPYRPTPTEKWGDLRVS